MKSFLMIVLVAVCGMLPAMAAGQTVPQVVRTRDTVGAFSQVDHGFTAALVTKDQAGVPYVAIHNPPGTGQGSVPPAAILVDEGKIKVQLSDGKQFTRWVPVEWLIETVKQADEAKTDNGLFKTAAWGRGGCANGICNAPVVVAEKPGSAAAVERPITLDKGDQPIVHGACCNAPVRTQIASTAWFSPRQGSWWDRGPVRRWVSVPWRGGPIARR